jgi:sugar transferase (PEP-CTERM/EpsH1 system associated)
MRILFVRQVIPYPPAGGTKQRGFNLLRELGKRHEVHLLAFHHPDQLAHADLDQSREQLLKFCSEVEYFRLWPKQSKAHAAVALTAALPLRVPFSVIAHKNRDIHRRILEICNSDRPPDLVHFDTIGLAPFAKLCGNIPCTLGHQNVESQLMERRAQAERTPVARLYGRIQTKRLLRYEREQCPRFRTNVVVSQLDADLMKAVAPGSHTTVIDNGVDVEFFKPLAEEGSPTMIYTGGMDMFANRDAVEWFIEAIWPRVTAAIPDARFLAVGQYPSARVRAAAAADSRIEVPGFVPDVRPWVARASVYVVPLRVGGGTRVKVVDAMAQGKAIVSTRVGAEGILGDDRKHFVLQDDPEAFASSVIHLLRDPDARRRLGVAARERAESQYAWPILGERLSQAFVEIVSGPRAPAAPADLAAPAYRMAASDRR